MTSLKVSLVTNAKEETKAFTQGVFPDDCEVLFQTEEEMLAQIADINVLIPGHITVGKDLIEKAKNLRLIHCGTGYNNVDMDAASANGTYIAVTPNVAAQSVAELVFSSFCALKNKINQFDNLMKNGGWKSCDFIGVPEFRGKTLGVVGYGNIGKCAAKIGRGFGMNIIAHDPYCKDAGDGTELVAMDTLLEQSDFITLHVLLTPETKGLMGTAQFKRMKNTAVIANACRGPVVDEKAIAQALRDREIAGACLDVYEKEPLPADSELRGLDNIVLTPHIAYCSDEALLARYAFFADNCQKVLDGDVPNMTMNADQVMKIPEDRLKK